MKIIQINVDDFLMDKSFIIDMDEKTGTIIKSISYYDNQPEIGIDETLEVLKLYDQNETFRDKVDFLFINTVNN